MTAAISLPRAIFLTDLHKTQFAINYTIADAPSVLGPLVHVEARERYADGAEELVDTQEIAMQGSEDDLGGISLRWYE